LEGYKKIVRGSAVLSAPVCTWIFLSTLFSYKCRDALTITTMIMLLLLFAAASYITFRSYSIYLDSTKKRAAVLILFTLFLALLSLLISVKTGKILKQEHLPVKISGFIAEIESVDKKRYNSDLYFTCESSPGFHARGILTYTGSSVINRGSIIAVHKSISRIDAGKNGYLLRLTREGIHFRGTVDDTEISVMDRGTKTLRISLQDSAREKIAAVFPHPVSALLIAIYFGDTSYLEKRTIMHFRDAGTLHLLAASGMNIALAASIPMLLLIPLGTGRRKALFISAAVTVFYLLITDMPVSLVRASAMYMFMIAGFFLSREKNSFNSLYLAGSIIILLMPWELYNPGFQLSFGATAGILFFYNRYRESTNNLPAPVSRSLAVTFAAQLAAYPLIYLHMNQFNPAGFITNLIEIPLITVITLLSLVILGISLISPVTATLSAVPVSLLSKCVFGLNEYAASLKLNFFIDDAVIPAAVMIISLFPLINLRFFSRMKAWPVFIALISSAILLKYGRNESDSDKRIAQPAEGIRIERNQDHLKLILELDGQNIFKEESLLLLRKIHPDIKIIEISNSTYNNISACRILMNDFIIEECIVRNVDSINTGFTGFLKILQKENIKVTIRHSDRS